jgi:hypothetical protein
MSTLPLVPQQMNGILGVITLAMELTLSTDPNPNNLDSPLNPIYTPQPGSTIPVPPLPPNYYGVRFSWQRQGQPFPNPDEDAVFIRAIEVDDLYNRIRDVHYEQTEDSYTKITNYTRVWEVFWCIYGPTSFDNARKVRTRLFDQDIHDLFAQSQLYLVTDPTAPQRIPEEKNGQWWERVDFSARFNEFVTETYETEPMISSEIIVLNELGTELFDVTIEEN